MTFRMFIDDERFPPADGQEWIICRTLQEVTRVCRNEGKLPDYVSFDHDLGENEPTGYVIAKWMVDMDLDEILKFPDNFAFYAHSQNPVGKKNIEAYLDNYLQQRNS